MKQGRRGMVTHGYCSRLLVKKIHRFFKKIPIYLWGDFNLDYFIFFFFFFLLLFISGYFDKIHGFMDSLFIAICIVI